MNVLIEDFPCQDKYQLRQREGHFIRELGTLNVKIEGRTKQEYRENNKEYQKEYYIENKGKIQERNKEHNKNYYENNKEKIQEYRGNNKEKISEQKKEYYHANKDKILDKKKEYMKDKKDIKQKYDKEYREANKDKIQQVYKEKITCSVCGSIFCKRSISKHIKSSKHQEYIKTILTQEGH